MPMFSYKSIPVMEMYDSQGETLFGSGHIDMLYSGDQKTPRQALELN